MNNNEIASLVEELTLRMQILESKIAALNVSLNALAIRVDAL